MLKLGAIFSLALLAVGAAVILSLGYADVISTETIEHAARVLSYACLTVFAVFWMIHAVKKR
jgi:hypothetical protein